MNSTSPPPHAPTRLRPEVTQVPNNKPPLAAASPRTISSLAQGAAEVPVSEGSRASVPSTKASAGICGGAILAGSRSFAI
jgi:hypothetical protein